MKLATVLLLSGCLSLAHAQNPYLFFAPQSANLNADAGTGAKVNTTVRMINTGPGFNYSVQGNQGWLEVFPTSGAVAAGGTVDFLVTCNPVQMQTGSYSGKVTITPSASTGQLSTSFDVFFTVKGIAFLLTPASLDLTLGPESSTTSSFNIANSDGTVREIQITPYTTDGANWLSTTNPSPILSPITVGVRVNSSGFDIGTVLTGELRISAPSLSGVTGVVPVKVTVVDQPPGFTVVPSQLTFYAFGTLAAPPQPVQVVANGGRLAYFDVTEVVPSPDLTVSINRGLTPSTFSVQMDTLAAVQLPRDDSLLITPTDTTPVVQLPVRTQLEPARVYSLPQVADGGDFKTSITLVNNDTTPAYVTVKFYKSEPTTHATVAWNPPIENNDKVENVVIQPNASWSVQTAATDAATSSGWAEVICREKISGVAVYRQSRPDGRFQEAAVPLNSTLMQRSLLPFDNASGFVSAMAIANVSTTETAKVRVAFRDELGRIIKVDRLPDIPARGHYAFALSSLWPYLADKRGTADLWITSGQISLLGLRFNPTGAFTSFEAQTFNRYTRGKRSLPQIADGGDSATSFRTSITLVNNDATQATVNLRFWRDTGSNTAAAWPLTFLNGVDPTNVTIAPGASVTLETAGTSPTVQSGWAEILSGQWVTGFAVFKQIVPGRPDQEAAVPINVATPGRTIMPFDNTGGFTTTVAVANMSGDVASVVNFTFRDLQGQRIVQVQLPEIPPNGHAAFRLIDLNGIVDGKKGSLEISSLAGEMTVMGLRFASSGAYTSFKANSLQ
ncbi:BACON domain-containing protein [Paludibaculum fermentans]|uniref:BACON domain-containing protein n=1 Tax=Paludibaculum fermentans TaxID=1473598 RepID=UPI003EBF7911